MVAQLKGQRDRGTEGQSEEGLFPRAAVPAAASPLPDQSAMHAAKRPRARKLRKPLGPFETECESFDRGMRGIEIVRLTAHVITYRLKGKSEEFSITHAMAFMRAVSADAGFDSGPRQSKRITRGNVAGVTG